MPRARDGGGAVCGCAIVAVTATGALVGALTQGMDGLKVVRIGAIALVAGAALITASVTAESLGIAAWRTWGSVSA